MIRYRVISRTLFLTLIDQRVFTDREAAEDWARKEERAGRIVAIEEEVE